MTPSRTPLLHAAVVHDANPLHVRAARSLRIRGLAAGALVLVLAACGDSIAVQITSPAEGEVVAEGASVLITLEVSGVTLAPAGTMEPGTGHHHLVVDGIHPVGGLPIPALPGRVHLGQAQTEYELTGLDAGEHTVIAVLGDGEHVPFDPWVVDTVRFVVGEAEEAP